MLLWPLMSLSLLSGFGVLLFGHDLSAAGIALRLAVRRELLAAGRGRESGPSDARAAISGCPVRPIGGCGDFMAAWGCWLAFPRIRPPRRWCVALLAVWIAVGFRGLRLAARSQPARLHVPQHGPRLRGASSSFPPARRCSTTPARWARRRPARARSPISSGSRPDASRRRRAFPSRHRPLQRPAGTAGEVLGGSGLRFAGHVREREPARRGAARAPSTSTACRCAKCGPAIGFGPATTARSRCCIRRATAFSVPDNANSLVLAVEYRGRRIVLPGDLESPGLDDMLAEEPRPCEVLDGPASRQPQEQFAGLGRVVQAPLGRVQRRRTLESARDRCRPIRRSAAERCTPTIAGRFGCKSTPRESMCRRLSNHSNSRTRCLTVPGELAIYALAMPFLAVDGHPPG